MSRARRAAAARAAGAGEVLRAFAALGCTSFGGPVAHLGYFRAEFVDRRGWVDDREYADIVALCQFLPGPASSQVGMALGLRRAGVAGMLAAFAGFTAPSAALLLAAAAGLSRLGGLGGHLAGLKAAAVAVVALAVHAMATRLAATRTRALIALAVFAAILLAPPGARAWAQPAALAAAALAGAALLREPAADPAAEPAPAAGPRPAGWAPPARPPRWLAPVAAAALVLGLASGRAAAWGGYFRAGALVFGGGHVVLPMLESGLVPDRVGADAFLAGYGLAQAVPGPLFTLAAYLGAVDSATPDAAGGLAGAGLALAAIFAPSMLLLLAVAPVWARLSAHRGARAAVAGVNAAVVGLLGAALVDPVLPAGVDSPATAVLAVAAAVALRVLHAPPWAVVLGAGLLGAAAG
ncbi:hypothetical protein CSPHI_08985 [Corynebacterium sphenisci DSM 44792]|uniref:Chromate transporter n=1 Tax=Corynebacterium sphenisci DSM 44792 TaxID=1437874 RepID=A0A1L7CZ50_9CORY|nr:chromate efflux transporter [Corynebacterium sphenisci]APT91128.1 hypothetical protein CSPHI_08985 [Corynebacterium sphenisci DSM 44792]